MKDHSALTLEWVCGEGIAAAFAARVGSDGGTVTGTTAFVPEPEEADLYSDAQFDPLVVVGVVLAAGLVMRYLRELILDLKGREIAVIDLTGEAPQVRIVPVGKASLVLVKAADGSVTKFAPSEIDKIEQSLAGLLGR
ncbi:hypothetical protein VB738_01305 [Cyanobium gracile UHCC 0139]|uniref:Uncharacterized protein n=1 Tax=Cyanobium gracile UHCC 0139 TaxID=3110308 RepID=A0ABU5RQ51_9CYAN|nr:hypothetical protein [Cyanobium gracile]MEA5389886.1 hypothetical protein [Cyanobium gracile UHCC 0139]